MKILSSAELSLKKKKKKKFYNFGFLSAGWLYSRVFVFSSGTDEYGEMVHSAMYPHMMTNVPKESMEYPDYSFHQHLKRECPSYITIPTAKEYIEGTTRLETEINSSPAEPGYTLPLQTV